METHLKQSENSKFEWAIALSQDGEFFYWAKLRDLTGRIIFNNPNPNDLESFINIYNSLVIECSSPIEELEIEAFNKLMETMLGQFFDGRYATPDSFLELIYFLQGQTFTPQWDQWLDVPLTVMIQMKSVVEKYPKPTL